MSKQCLHRRYPAVIVLAITCTGLVAHAQQGLQTERSGKMQNMTRIGVVQTVPIRPENPKDDPQLNPYSEQFDAARVREKVIEPNIAHFTQRLRRAGEAGCDLVLLTEDTQGVSSWLFCGDRPEVQQAVAETIPGPTTDAFGAVAREFGMYVVAGLMEKEGEHIYNTAVLIGRDGSIVGKYHKTHLPLIEAAGVTAGDTFPVFDTDFGRVGMLVCYDWIFPEAAACIAAQGADMICVPTMAYGWSEDGGEATLKCRAADHSVVVAISTYPRQFWPGRSGVANRAGQILADCGYDMDGMCFADVDVSAYRYDKFVQDLSISDLGGRLFLARRPEIYAPLTDAHSPASQTHSAKPHLQDRYDMAQVMKRVHDIWGYEGEK